MKMTELRAHNVGTGGWWMNGRLGRVKGTGTWEQGACFGVPFRWFSQTGAKAILKDVLAGPCPARWTYLGRPPFAEGVSGAKRGVSRKPSCDYVTSRTVVDLIIDLPAPPDELMTLPRADQADGLLTSGLVYPARPGWRAAGEAGVTEGQADWGDLEAIAADCRNPGGVDDVTG